MKNLLSLKNSLIMKKVFTSFVLLFTLLMTSASYAQTGFKLKATSYVGALSSDPATDWT